MPAAKKKRPKQGETSAKPAKRNKPPEYGQQDYWNSRYRAVLIESNNNDTNEDAQEVGDADAPLPYHEWYFTYDELRPLLIPLLFGPQSHHFLGDEAGEADDDTSHSLMNAGHAEHYVDVADSQAVEVECKGPASGNGDDVGSSDDELIADDDDDDPELEDDDEQCDSDDEPEPRPGLAAKGAMTILEVGCGDRPLGAALAAEFCKLSSQGKCGLPLAGDAFKSIVCSDYSPVVIDVMKKQYATSRSQVQSNTALQSASRDTGCTLVGDVPLEFRVMDATALPCPSNSVELVLDKGTLDAVLSDTSHGSTNAIQIMSECARVTMPGGYILLISHLNAHFPAGLSWLETIVFAGLKKGDDSSEWSIEVHGKDDLSRADDESDDSMSPEATGPAVYIISKLPRSNSEEKGTVSVRFYSY